MQQQRSKTPLEMMDDLAEMVTKSQDPNSTPERRQAFSDAADSIRRRLASAVGTPIGAPPRNSPMKPTVPLQPPPAKARTATRITLNPTPKPQTPHPPLKVATASPTRYQAHHTSVTIHWATGERTYRYHEVRSRFFISLKNLIHSTANNQVTYKEIENYAAWGNAKTYYQAITAIWGHPPTFQELNFSPSTLDLSTLEEMFERVVKNDEA